jgi:hypothetical protein
MSQKILLALVLTAIGFTDAFQSQSRIHKNNELNLGTATEFLSIGKNDRLTLQRRGFIETLVAAGATLVASPRYSFADTASDTQQSGAYISPPNQKFGYTITPPPSFTTSNKPLKTHLDEINFSGDIRGYTLGVTVDPVRIKSIREFGTPEEVAARVVTAEVNRDGVFEVTLAKDPVEDVSGCYDIEYISDGKRGTKRFVTRIYIKDGFLYVLTAQSKNDEYDQTRENEIMASVRSFRPQ